MKKTIFLQLLLIGLLIWAIRPIKLERYEPRRPISPPSRVSLDFEASQVEEMPIPDIPTPPQKYTYKTATCEDWGKVIDANTENEQTRDWMKRVMFCESTCRESVSSPSGTYKGLYQYEDRTWNANCEGDIFNGFDQIDCTLKLYRQGEQWRWPVCGR